MSLLDKALAARKRRGRRSQDVTIETVEVALAYLHGRITAAQLSVALECGRGNSVSFIPAILREGLRRGWCRVEMIEPNK